MLTLKKVKELVEAPSHAKRTPSPKMLFEEGIVLLRRDFDQGSHLTVYNSGYVLFSAGKRNTVFHIHDCQGDYAYDAAEGKGDVIEEEYFENCEWHIRALFEGERKMEDNQAKCEDAGRSNVCVSYHALSEDWSEIADRTINMLEKIIENPFEMKVQGIDRTLADKVFAVCDYYLQGKVAKHSRHLYDIYKLLPLVPQDENFKELVKEVRAVREQSVICPSALPEANVPELLEKIIKEKAYKQDYDTLTTQLLEENVPYDTVIATLKKVAESSIFENN